ncbi:MAG: DUF3095 domain-containing protein [Rhizobiaceae bacterium]|nr:DUF3095 domain-containing protein [Rhizobiaceae bacterium]
MTAAPEDSFLATIPVFSDFGKVADAANYRPLPETWMLGVADIVGSTRAITAGRYKAVNMAGASVISALLNATGNQQLPYAFGGDGAVVAFPGADEAVARTALAAVQAWVKDEIDLVMRAALVPVTAVRAGGLDVRVARFQASEHVSYAMFNGGGSSWAEAEMKAGRFLVTAASQGTRPDLTGLSCRWNPIETRHGAIVSIVAVPRDPGSAAFRKLVADITELTAADRSGHPVPVEGPRVAWPEAQSLAMEAKAARPAGRRWTFGLGVLAQATLLNVLYRSGKALGRFDARRYAAEVSENSDFRKFDDGLKMTVDIDEETLRRVEARLDEAERAGVCAYGLHRQDSALITCLVMSPLAHDHVHFVDGAAGGYTMAAANLKAKVAA